MEGGGSGGSALVKGFKDLTIPHPLRLSFISNNQAWPQNIPLDGKNMLPVRLSLIFRLPVLGFPLEVFCHIYVFKHFLNCVPRL